MKRATSFSLLALLVLFSVSAAGCSRHADLVDQEDALVIVPPRGLDGGDIPVLDSGLGTDVYSACSMRMVGKCEGPVDFGCTFNSWVDSTAARCNAAGGCKATGWLEVKLDGEGCVTSIGMDNPSDALVKCLLDELVTTRCSCTALTRRYFFGFTAAGDAGCSGPKG